MPDIFISHASSTVALTRRVAEALRRLGEYVCWDEYLPVHRPYAHEIDARARAAKVVLVIWSTDASQRVWVRSEANVGLEAGTLVQVTVDGTVPPMPFEQI